MGLLIFGFMWMNSSKQKEIQQQQQQEQAEAKQAAADEPQITVDSISAAEAAAIPAAIREGVCVRATATAMSTTPPRCVWQWSTAR